MKLLKVCISIVALVVVATITLLLVLKLDYKKEGVVDQVGHAQSSVINAVDKSTQIKPINQETTEKPTAKSFLESLTKPKTPVVANENVDGEYSTMLNVALTGDLEKAVKISKLQTECDTLLFRKTLLNNTYIRNSESMLESEIEQEMNNQRNRQHNKFEKDVKKCMDAFNGDYDSKLGKLARHDELYQQALAGNAMAKFIYAMQVHSDPYVTELFIQDIDFEVEALAFTNENLIDHPYLGLLAYGQSYTTGSQFTPIRLSIGMSYLIAAGICGANPDVINELAMFQFFSTGNWDSLFAPMESILSLADTLSLKHCPV